jgi:hypothetical protein
MYRLEACSRNKGLLADEYEVMQFKVNPATSREPEKFTFCEK